MGSILGSAPYKRFLGFFTYTAVACFLLGSERAAAEKVVQPEASVIQIEQEPGPNPWTHLEFPDANVNFQFAVVSDNTGGAYPGVFEAAMTKLNLMQPEFVMSVGDLIEGYSNNREQLLKEWDEIDVMVDSLDMPFFYVVGNHDVGDKVSRAVWQERLGRNYYHFVYKDVLFLCMDTEDPPQGLPDWLIRDMLQVRELEESDPPQAKKLGDALLLKVRETFKTGEEFAAAFSDRQVTYFKNVLAQYPEVKWTFLFVHRPVWQAGTPDQRFMEIEAALEGRPYTVFAGHAHTYDYQQRKGMDYIRLSTTGGAWVLEPPGNFDHIAWITMTDEGPVVGNITLDGIFDKTGVRKPVRDTFQ
jgi:predicted phosphodiesterase